MPSTDPERPLEVAVGVLQAADGRVLLAQRRKGVHLEHLWEFPGGKIEPGETAEAALARELTEELGIVVQRARRHLLIPYRYPTVHVLLHVFRVNAWAGEARSMEGQPLQWVVPAELGSWATPPASRAIVHALQLPPRYLITPDPGSEAAIGDVVRRLERYWARHPFDLLQIRAPSLEPRSFARFADAVLDVAESHPVSCLINSSQSLSPIRPGVGLHLTGRRLRELRERPACSGWIGASVHDGHSLQLAMDLPVDFVVIGPVHPTATHPGATVLGLEGFAWLCSRSSVPAYALGGMRPGDLESVLEAGGQGVAGIRHLLDDDSTG